MRNRQSSLNTFLEQLYQIEKSLNGLDLLAYSVSREYDGNKFPEQKKLAADTLENLMLAATHETASQIGFLRRDIETLAQLIDFRERYAQFSDQELAQILDGYLSIHAKNAFAKRFESIEKMIAELDSLKQDWNQTFANKSYGQIKKQLGLAGTE